MSGINKVQNIDSNDLLEQKTDELKESNSQENYDLKSLLDCMIKELKEINKQLTKINS